MRRREQKLGITSLLISLKKIYFKGWRNYLLIFLLLACHEHESKSFRLANNFTIKTRSCENVEGTTPKVSSTKSLVGVIIFCSRYVLIGR